MIVAFLGKNRLIWIGASAGDSAVDDSANKSPDDDESFSDTSPGRGESNLLDVGLTVTEKLFRRKGIFPGDTQKEHHHRFTINRVSGVNSRK